MSSPPIEKSRLHTRVYSRRKPLEPKKDAVTKGAESEVNDHVNDQGVSVERGKRRRIQSRRFTDYNLDRRKNAPQLEIEDPKSNDICSLKRSSCNLQVLVTRKTNLVNLSRSASAGSEEVTTQQIKFDQNQSDDCQIHDGCKQGSNSAKRKQTICSIFDNIWSAEKSEQKRSSRRSDFPVGSTRSSTPNVKLRTSPIKNETASSLSELVCDIFSRTSSNQRHIKPETVEISSGSHISNITSQKLESYLQPIVSVKSDDTHFCFTTASTPYLSPVTAATPDLTPVISSTPTKEHPRTVSGDDLTDTDPDSPSKVYPILLSLHELQIRCNERSKTVTLQLLVCKKPVPKTCLRTAHRKRRKRSRIFSSRRRRPVLPNPDADDELSEGDFRAPSAPCPMGGPLANIDIRDLWMQKGFYLRYLCNFYKLSSEGCREWLVSRLHQHMLQSSNTPALTRYPPRPAMSRGQQGTSWVAHTLKQKASSWVAVL